MLEYLFTYLAFGNDDHNLDDDDDEFFFCLSE